MPDREKVISWVEGLAEDDWRLFHSDSEVQNIAKAVLALLKEQRNIIKKLLLHIGEQEIYATKIVRCKDCKFFNDYFVECEKNNHTHGAAWFCADGERK